jgi:glycosyltransferase involved in cell wall biosynthesis
MITSTAAIIPAYDAEPTIGEVVRSLAACWRNDGHTNPILVVDDGSRDDTGRLARRAGADVIRHAVNRGKGAALRAGMRAALERGFECAVTVDADGQHPAEEAARLAALDADPRALVLGVRDLISAGAPNANIASNRISNFWMSIFAGRPLADTQCGLRRYPLRETLALDPHDDGYAFEAEVILLAIRAGLPVVQVPVRVLYGDQRSTHFHVVKDPARIVVRVLRTLAR